MSLLVHRQVKALTVGQEVGRDGLLGVSGDLKALCGSEVLLDSMMERARGSRECKEEKKFVKKKICGMSGRGEVDTVRLRKFKYLAGCGCLHCRYGEAIPY